jgi:hypothetical protein
MQNPSYKTCGHCVGGYFPCYVCYNTHYTVYSKLARFSWVQFRCCSTIFGPEINDARMDIDTRIGLVFRHQTLAIALIMYIASRYR